MALQKINTWMNLAANVGVIAGIVFLAFEIQQNNDLLTAQARAVGEENRMRDEIMIMNNPALREVLVKKNREIETTPEEELLYRVFQSTVLNGWQATWLEYKAGLIEIEGYIDRWRDMYWRQQYEKRWENTKHRYRTDFVAWMDRNILTDPPID